MDEIVKKGSKKETIVLLDTHAIIHRAYHAIPELSSPSGEPVNAVYGLSTMLMRIITELKPDHVIAAYDLPGPTHRHEVYENYKAKRPKTDDSLISQINRSRDVLKAFGIPIYEAPGFEADDCIGTIVELAKNKFDIIIASGDMDTLQLVDKDCVRVYTLRKGIQDTVLYNEQGVLDRFGFLPKYISDYKGFAGDSSDNIIGIPGVGEKTATNLIKTFGGMEEVYKVLKKNPQKFLDAGFTARNIKLLEEHEDEAEFSKVLATIRIDAPVRFITPSKTFREIFDEKKVTEFFTSLGFRSLITRLRQFSNAHTDNKTAGEEKKETAPREMSKQDEALYKRAALMLWLSQSDTTNPTLDDILENTKSNTLQEAEEKLKVVLEKHNLTKVFNAIEEPLMPVIDAMNEHGVLIDTEYLKTLAIEYHKELDRLSVLIYASAGQEFNISSPKQLGEILFGTLGIKAEGVRQKKTATGQASTRESELLKLKDEHPIIEMILSHREIQKLLSTYIDAIPPLLDSERRLHTSFIQTGTSTGRLSSRDPNVQNIPVKTELGRRIRRAFVAPTGSVLMALDYSQIELRLAALLSGDEKLTTIFKEGNDVHAAVAAEVFGVEEKDVTSDMRRKAKVINFGILYGMGVNALRENLGGDRAEAQEFYNRYFETFTGLAEYLSKTKASAARVGYTETFFGRKRFFPNLRSKLPYVRAMAERMAINAPIQGTQSDIIKLAMVKIQNLIDTSYKGKVAMVLQIHDELIFEVSKEVVDEVAVQIRKVMEHVLTEEEAKGIPIIVSAKVGLNWEEMIPQ